METADTYGYDPIEVAGGPSQLFAGGEQSPAVLACATEVTGPITFTFWAASTATDANFCARLIDVAPDGTATQITRGWLNGPHYPDPANPRPLAPGQTYRFSMEIWPTSHVFECCHVARMVPFSDGLGLNKWVVSGLSWSVNRVAWGVKSYVARPPSSGGREEERSPPQRLRVALRQWRTLW